MAFVPLKPIPIKDRNSLIFIGKGRVDVRDGAFVVVDDVNGERILIPVGSIACLMLEPGTRISHAAIKLAADVGTLITWVGEGGVRLYSAGQPGGARSDRLLYQAKLALDPELRLKVVRKMFEYRFGEEAPKKRSIDQLRGIEGARVRSLYQDLASKYGVKWTGRDYDPKNWDQSNGVNKAISVATSCLYGITEAAILAAGYAPAIGFLHSGKPLSFVYDIADLVKFETVIPIAFKIVANASPQLDRDVRVSCREAFRATRLLDRLIPLIEEILAAGEIALPKAYDDAQPIAFEDDKGIGDKGHRGGDR